MGSDWAERDAAVVWHGFTQMAAFTDNASLIIERAEGHELIDVEGRRYLDAISSLWVNTLGHRVPELDQALIDQLEKVAHSTLLGNGNRVVIELAEALARVVPVAQPHFLFASDGAAAVEQALKMAFQYWVNRAGSGLGPLPRPKTIEDGRERIQGLPEQAGPRHLYLAFGDAYHGDTVGAISLGDSGFGNDIFDPLRFPVLRAPGYDDPDCMEVATKLIHEHAGELAAVIVEPLVQGAAGMKIVPKEDFAMLAEACRATGVLLICDEVATGFGRTGTLFASEQCHLEPDILCLGKGLTGGYLPMSVTVASQRVYEAFLGDDLGPKTFYHGHSYGGNALAAAVALKHLELILQTGVLANVRARSTELRQLLDEKVTPLPAVAQVRLCGLMGGVELHPGDVGGQRGRRVCAASVKRGVLLRPLGDVIVLMPPLTIRRSELNRIVDVLAEAITEVTGS